jgi:hypothetical protein
VHRLLSQSFLRSLAARRVVMNIPFLYYKVNLASRVYFSFGILEMYRIRTHKNNIDFSRYVVYSVFESVQSWVNLYKLLLLLRYLP